jgi:hypothetical protein
VITWDSLGSLFPRLSDEQIFSVMGSLLSPPPPPPTGPLGRPRLGGH